MSENKVPFTAGRVSKFCCEAGKAASFFWDTESTGLGLKASAGGAKNYVLAKPLGVWRNGALDDRQHQGMDTRRRTRRSPPAANAD
jgi:hypothetical protein